MVFIDSLQFISSSLDKLVSNLPNDAFKYTFEEIKNDKNLKFMKQKDVSEKKLPNKDDFYSILNDERISDTQYVHAIKVWKTFKLMDMGEYHDLYLKSDASFYYLMDLKTLERLVCNIMDWIPVIISQVLDYLGMQCWKWLISN